MVEYFAVDPDEEALGGGHGGGGPVTRAGAGLRAERRVFGGAGNALACLVQRRPRESVMLLSGEPGKFNSWKSLAV